MARSRRTTAVSIEIDKLTNSIELAATGDILETVVVQLTRAEKRLVRKRDWLFNWHGELALEGREVYRLSIIHNPKVIQGLISIEDLGDHVRMHLIESAAHNRGAGKLFLGVPGNLVAQACKVSFEKGYEGYVNFVAKTVLIEHYRTMLGAHVFKDNLMYLDTPAARILVQRYMKDL